MMEPRKGWWKGLQIALQKALARQPPRADEDAADETTIRVEKRILASRKLRRKG